jgi:hypothetical protein
MAWLVVLFQTRDPDLESGDDMEQTDREYCQVVLPSLTYILYGFNSANAEACK